MRKTLSLSLLLAGVLLAALVAEAKGPKGTFTVTSDSGVTSASVDVTLCGTTDCSSEFAVCPNTQVTGPNQSVKTSCSLDGVKPVVAYQYAISINPSTGSSNCFGVAPKDTPTVCQANGGTITVTIK